MRRHPQLAARADRAVPFAAATFSLPPILTLAIASAFLLLAAAGRAAPAAEAPALLWEIGKADDDDREFALAPGGYVEFKEDGFWAVGRSKAERDWPYVHPGPDDGWAGGRQHAFTVVFGLEAAPASGECRLRLDLVDTHGRAPPRLRIALNGEAIRPPDGEDAFRLPPGAGDASVFGEPAKGKECRLEVPFPASALRTGPNEIAITTLSGSWIVYDAVALEAPRGAKLAEVEGTIVSSMVSPPVLIEREGRLLQTLRLAVRHFGDAAEALVRVGEGGATMVALREATQTLEVTVPAVERETPTTVSFEVGGKRVAEQTVVLRPVRRWVVYLLPHSHVDIGYTHVQTDVERAQWAYLEMAMEAARRSEANPPGARFKWNVEILWAVDGYLRQATPEKREAFYEAVRKGQVGLQALYGNQLTGLSSPEEMLRLLGFAAELSGRIGVPIESAMITDVPGYTWGVVPAFAHSGVKYFSIGPNGGDRIGHTAAAWGDKPFWWIGPNGRDRVLVWMTGTGYYRVFQSPESLLGYLGRLEAGGYAYDYVQVRHCLGDNGAPDVDFAESVKAWNEKYAYPRLVIATTDEMFRDFERRYGGEIPSARGDFTPYWEDGAASSALETAMNRASADRLVQAQALFALGSSRAYPEEGFYQAWRDVLLYDEHTWGAHNSISQPDHPFVKSQWAIKRAFAVDGDAASRRLLVEAAASRGPEARPPAAGPSAGSGRVDVVDVVNTTGSFIPYGLVVVPAELSRAGDAVKPSPVAEETLPAQRLTTGELVFRSCWGPYWSRRYWIVEGQAKAPPFEGARAEGSTLTTPGLTVRLDERTGAIASLRAKGIDGDLVDPGAPTALNDYFYLPGSDLGGLERNGPARISVKERGPFVASLLVESDAPGTSRLSREVRVHAVRHYVEIIDLVDKKPVRSKEGVHFGFGFNVPGGTVRMDTPWAVVRPEEDQIPGACKNWFTVGRWVDISNDRFGVTWLTLDAPLVEVGGITANLIGSLSDPRAWRDRVEPSQTIYSWAMNNHWHTNYRAEQEGPTVFRYHLVPHSRPFRGEEAARLGLEMSQPLLVLPARGEVTLRSRLDVSDRTVVIVALKPSEDRKALIVRLFGASGEDARTELEWAEPAPKALWLSDASEAARSPVVAPVDVPAWSIVTLRAEMP